MRERTSGARDERLHVAHLLIKVLLGVLGRLPVVVKVEEIVIVDISRRGGGGGGGGGDGNRRGRGRASGENRRRRS